VFDFYFWSDEEHDQGWKRRVILDSWSTPSQAGKGLDRREGSMFEHGKGKFLFTSGDKNHASKREDGSHTILRVGTGMINLPPLER
jgi:hypothetical protein